MREDSAGAERIRMTANDFVTGLVAELVFRGKKTLSLERTDVDRAMESAFEQNQDDPRIDFRFRIRRNHPHDMSVTARAALTGLLQRGLASLDGPDYQVMRFQFGKDEAAKILGTMAAERSFYSEIADQFSASYDGE